METVILLSWGDAEHKNIGIIPFTLFNSSSDLIENIEVIKWLFYHAAYRKNDCCHGKHDCFCPTCGTSLKTKSYYDWQQFLEQYSLNDSDASHWISSWLPDNEDGLDQFGLHAGLSYDCNSGFTPYVVPEFIKEMMNYFGEKPRHLK